MNLPMYRELAIDFVTGELLKTPPRKNWYGHGRYGSGPYGGYIQEDSEGLIVYEENSAVAVWIWKALKTERFKYKGYSESFGNELHEDIGYVYSREVKEQLMFKEIEECLMVNPYIKRVYNFKTEVSEAGTKVKINFDVETIYGAIDWEVYDVII